MQLSGVKSWSCVNVKKSSVKKNPSSATIALINKGLKRKPYTITEAFTRITKEFTRVGISFSTGRWMSCFGMTPFKYSPAGWTVEYHPDTNWQQNKPFAPGRDCSLKNRIFMDERERGISKPCGLIRKVSQKPQKPLMPEEETGEGKTS